MIRGFLFDLDGTLVDTHKANFEAYKKAIENFGTTIAWENFRPTIGKTAKEFLPLLAPDLTVEQYEQVRKLKAEYYKDLLHLTAANKPLIEFMKTMAVHYPCALVTTAQPANAHAILQHHGLAEAFTVIVTAGDVEKHKPHPDGYHEALKRLKLRAEQTITFEDSETGRLAAEAAGIPVIMVRDFVV
jgi:HAD superfamily hydrolase (TIGR01509 family)